MSSTTSCASRWNSPADTSCSTSNTPTSRAGYSGAAVSTSSPRKSAAASAETTSAGIRCEIASATALLPLAVGPKIASNASATKPLARALQVLVRETRGAEVSLDAAVAPLELLEHSDHRLGGRRRDAPNPFALYLCSRLGEPEVVARAQPLLARRVVGCDLLVVDAREVEQQCRDEAGAILATHAVNHDDAFGSTRDSGDRRPDVLAKAFEEDEVDLTRRPRGVGRCRCNGLDLGERRFIVLEKRHMHDLDRHVRRRVGLELAVHTKVDHGPHAVIDGRRPAGVRQLADAVGSDDCAVTRLRAVLRAVPAEVAYVEAAFPDELSFVQRHGLRGDGRALHAVQSLRGCGFDQNIGEFARLSVARKVDRRVAPRAPAQERRLRPRGPLHEDFLDTADPLLVPQLRDPVYDLDEALDPLAFKLVRDLVPGRGCFGPLPRRVDESEGAVVADLLDDLDRLAKVIFCLSREADDDVRRQREVGNRGA